MRSHLRILETVKPLKMILDSAMASKMNIYHKKLPFFYLEDDFHPKKTSWSLGGTKPFEEDGEDDCLVFYFSVWNMTKVTLLRMVRMDIWYLTFESET